MLKVLIADDEQKICQLIEKLIDWSGLNMQMIGTAENGLEALEKIQSQHPDIVITDIRMPGCDGLELIQRGKETNPKTEFIIISGYRHFEYAQTAIRYGVNAYVLKPIKKDELNEVLTKLREKILQKTAYQTDEEQLKQTLRTDKETLRRAFFTDLLFHRSPERLLWPLERINQEFRYAFSFGEFCIAVLKIDGRIFDCPENLEFIQDKVYHAAHRLLEGWVNEYEITTFGGFFYFLIQICPEQKTSLRRQLKLLLDELRIQGEILQNLAVTIALGTYCPQLSAIETSLENARGLMEERFIEGTWKLLEGSLPVGKNFAEQTVFADFRLQMSQALESLEVFPVRDAMLQLKTKMLSLEEITGHELLQAAKELIHLYLFSMKNYRIPIEENLQEKLLYGIENCASAAELFDYLIREITISYEKAARQKRQDENRPVRAVKQFVAAHYAESLTLEQASDIAGLSPAYLSTVFKKDTGMTFLEYLSKVRMDKAKQLLKETNRTVADICAAVGYSDVRYFTKSFTKYSGLKPNEYRKLYS